LLAALAAAVVVYGVISLFVTGFSKSFPLRLLQGIGVFGLGAVVMGTAVVLTLVRLAGWRESDAEFELLVRRAERLAATDRWGEGDDELFEFLDEPSAHAHDLGHPYQLGRGHEEHGYLPATNDQLSEAESFDALIRDVVAHLPIQFHLSLEHVAIVVVDDGGVPIGGPGASGVAAGVPMAVERRSGTYGTYGRSQGDTVAGDHFRDRIVIFRDALVRDFGHDPLLLRDAVSRTVRDALSGHL
jgi:hypothetical protein